MRQVLGNNLRKFFITIQMILYLTFLIIDLIGGSSLLSSGVKYTIVLLCFFYTLLIEEGRTKKILFCYRTALLFTVIADFFLLLLDYHYLYGILSFLVVQQIYGIKLDETQALNQSNSKFKGKDLSFISLLPLLRFGGQLLLTLAVCLVLYSFKIPIDSLLVTSSFYFINIVTNVIRAIHLSLKNPSSWNDRIFAIGMILFLLCDINVGLYNLSGFITLTEAFYNMVVSISSILMWAFYAPSQVMIVLSLDEFSQNR
ncbi:MAG: hypothetical protein GX306_07910 [Clostridiales bacterium]|jgi:hypothetical protein|nr:hypothetical protein [Clostridiales bacterium]